MYDCSKCPAHQSCIVAAAQQGSAYCVIKLMQKTAGQRKDRSKDLSWENLERVKATIICEAMALVLSGEYEGGKQTDGNVHGNL